MYRLKKLPYKKEFNSIQIYKHLSNANYRIGELKGLLDSIPYLGINLKLINLFESKNSSDIEGVNTCFKSIFIESIAAKKTDSDSSQVVNQLRATNIIYRDITTKNKITIKDLNRIQELIVPDYVGLRKVRGYKIYNKLTHKVLYTPPQNEYAIMEYYKNLIDYINAKESKYDPLIKMAIIHYQFECIQPYKKGNGKVGRILNIMSLVHCGRLAYPILNLSKFFNDTKVEYFSLLEKCHNDISYLDEFIIYVLKGIHETASYTINFIHQINRIINITKQEFKKKNPTLFSDKLIEHLFKYPYTKNELLRIDLNISRSTASKYLKSLVDLEFLESEKHGKEIVYKNKQLVNLFQMN